VDGLEHGFPWTGANACVITQNQLATPGAQNDGSGGLSVPRPLAAAQPTRA
jgi:hypothetical protein